jgi:DNA-binding NtrC family response regulator
MTRRKNLKTGLERIVDELVQKGVTLEQARKEFERQFIVASIRSNEGNLGRSARSLGVHRNTLRNKVSNLGIAVEDCNPRSSLRRGQRREAVKNGAVKNNQLKR